MLVISTRNKKLSENGRAIFSKEKTSETGKAHGMVVKEEVENIKKAINKSRPTEKDLEDFVDSISEEKK